MSSLLKRVGIFLVSVGPGIFGIGYPIGTGSVSTMAKIGADYGSGLIWILSIACLFSFVLMEAFGRYSLIARDTTIHSVKSKLGFNSSINKIIAVVMIIGVMLHPSS